MRENNRDMIKAYIKRSHERCLKHGIDKNKRFSKKIIIGDELEERLNKNKELMLISEPFLNQLRNFVKGSNFFTILTDEEGCILSVDGDEEIFSEAFNIKMIPGAYMDEKNIGTNAMSIALSDGIPVQISGKEHFIKAYHRWTCSAAPIRDTTGRIIGTLDLTGYSDSVHSHTLGMVVAAVNAIERMIKINVYNDKLVMSKRYTETIIDSIPAGILTSDLDGNIRSANKYVAQMFGYAEEEVKQLKIKQLFDSWPKVKKTIFSKNAFLDQDVFVNSRKNKLQFSLSAHPILDNNQNIRDVLYIFRDVKKVRKLANAIMGRQAIYTFDKIIGQSDKFLKIIEYAKKISDSKSSILIMGESGTGKEIFAQSIHNYSSRRDEPFVAINCAAIPKNLIESELFGYEEGAFTGAKKGGHPGKFEIADGGTIFLDEIGEMPIDMQSRLLRVIEEQTVCRIGSTNDIVVNVRIITATNKNLNEEVKKGNFRKDLFYRLNVLPLKLNPLRERKEDIPLLIDYFMNRISRKLNKKKVKISKGHMKHLLEYKWPGNVRELENFIELIINTECIPLNVNSEDKTIEISSGYNIIEENLSLDYIEKEHIIRVLKRFKGNITNSAKALGVGRNTLYRKINKYKINCSKIQQCSILEQ